MVGKWCMGVGWGERRLRGLFTRREDPARGGEGPECVGAERGSQRGGPVWLGYDASTVSGSAAGWLSLFAIAGRLPFFSVFSGVSI